MLSGCLSLALTPSRGLTADRMRWAWSSRAVVFGGGFLVCSRCGGRRRPSRLALSGGLTNRQHHEPVSRLRPRPGELDPTVSWPCVADSGPSPAVLVRFILHTTARSPRSHRGRRGLSSPVDHRRRPRTGDDHDGPDRLDPAGPRGLASPEAVRSPDVPRPAPSSTASPAPSPRSRRGRRGRPRPDERSPGRWRRDDAGELEPVAAGGLEHLVLGLGGLGQAVDLDEALGGRRVVLVALLVGGQLVAVEAARRSCGRRSWRGP